MSLIKEIKNILKKLLNVFLKKLNKLIIFLNTVYNLNRYIILEGVYRKKIMVSILYALK